MAIDKTYKVNFHTIKETKMTATLTVDPVSCSITKAKKIVEILFSTNQQKVTPCLIGGPGVGKSSIFRQLKKQLGFDYLIDLRLSQHDNTDIKGVPKYFEEDGYEFIKWVSPEFIPLKGSKYENKKGIFLLDEINRADPQTLQSVFEGVHDRCIGGKPILDSCYIACAGNFGYEDGTDVHEMDSALKNRMSMIYITENVIVKDWLDWARDENIHPIILNFIEQYSSYLYLDNETIKNHPRHGLVTGRSWEQLSDVLHDNPGSELDVAMYVADTLVYSATPKLVEMIRKRDKLKPRDVMLDFEKFRGQLAKVERNEKYGIANEIGYLILNDEKTNFSTIDNVSKFFREVIEDVDHQTVFLQHIFKNEEYFKKFIDANADIFRNSDTILGEVVTKCLFSQG